LERLLLSFHTYFRSSRSARVLIPARLKNIPLTYSHVDLSKADHHKDSFRSLNPSEAVPVLVVRDSERETIVSQSIAILEYFEEIGHQDRVALLPSVTHPKDRGKVRELMGIIASDLFRPTNGRIAQLGREIRGELTDQVNCVHRVMSIGFSSYESMLQGCSGRYTSEMLSRWLMYALCLRLKWLRRTSWISRHILVSWPFYGDLMKLTAFKESSWKVQRDKIEKLSAVA
jgi:hypothetical protein